MSFGIVLAIQIVNTYLHESTHMQWRCNQARVVSHTHTHTHTHTHQHRFIEHIRTIELQHIYHTHTRTHTHTHTRTHSRTQMHKYVSMHHTHIINAIDTMLSVVGALGRIYFTFWRERKNGAYKKLQWERKKKKKKRRKLADHA